MSASATQGGHKNMTLKAKLHYTMLVADRSEAGRRPEVSWNFAYHVAR